MTSNTIVPCAWLNSIPEFADNPGGQPRGSVLTVAFEIAGQSVLLD